METLQIYAGKMRDILSELDKAILQVIKEEEIEAEVEETSEYMDTINLSLNALDEVKGCMEFASGNIEQTPIGRYNN